MHVKSSQKFVHPENQSDRQLNQLFSYFLFDVCFSTGTTGICTKFVTEHVAPNEQAELTIIRSQIVQQICDKKAQSVIKVPKFAY